MGFLLEAYPKTHALSRLSHGRTRNTETRQLEKVCLHGSPGAPRMHLLLKADPTKESRYCSSHEECCRAYQEELGLEAIRYLSGLPMVEMEAS